MVGLFIWQGKKPIEEKSNPINLSDNNPINKSIVEIEKKEVVADTPVTPPVVAVLPPAKDTEALKDNFNFEISLDKVVGKKWVWLKNFSYDFSVSTPKKPEAFSLTFGKDGSFTGTTDCNSIFGKYTAKGGVMKLSSIGGTKMFCENSEELKFTSYLSQVSGFMSNGEGNLVLKLEFDSGSMIFE